MSAPDGYLQVATRRICGDLGLPPGDAFTQDWAYELAASYRTDEYLGRYLIAHDSTGYGPHERHVLMKLILDVFNDMYSAEPSSSSRFWTTISEVLGRFHIEHADLVTYWACADAELEDAYAISSLVRYLRNPVDNPDCLTE
jgi:hypothetical protein